MPPPDFYNTSFLPPWKALEDVCLCDSMLLKGLFRFEFNGLGPCMAASSSEAQNKIESIASLFATCGTQRNVDDIVRRFHQLRSHYGNEPANFKAAYHAARRAKNLRVTRHKPDGWTTEPLDVDEGNTFYGGVRIDGTEFKT